MIGRVEGSPANLLSAGYILRLEGVSLNVYEHEWAATLLKKAQKPCALVSEIEESSRTSILEVSSWKWLYPVDNAAPRYVIYMEANGKMQWHRWDDELKLAREAIDETRIISATEVVLAPKVPARF